jgi:hypothetical protein
MAPVLPPSPLRLRQVSCGNAFHVRKTPPAPPVFGFRPYRDFAKDSCNDKCFTLGGPARQRRGGDHSETCHREINHLLLMLS